MHSPSTASTWEHPVPATRCRRAWRRRQRRHSAPSAAARPRPTPAARAPTTTWRSPPRGPRVGLPTGATNGGGRRSRSRRHPTSRSTSWRPRTVSAVSATASTASRPIRRATCRSQRDTASSLAEINNPRGWFYLTVVNQGGAASNFTASVTQNGRPISLPASCVVPTTLAASGSPGDTFSCIFPRTFSADPGVRVGRERNSHERGDRQRPATVGHRRRRPPAAGPRRSCRTWSTRPNPTADGTNKTVAQGRTTYQTDFTGTFTTNPVGAADSLHVIAQRAAGLHLQSMQRRSRP